MKINVVDLLLTYQDILPETTKTLELTHRIDAVPYTARVHVPVPVVPAFLKVVPLATIDLVLELLLKMVTISPTLKTPEGTVIFPDEILTCLPVSLAIKV
jgi:hypothetical protein